MISILLVSLAVSVDAWALGISYKSMGIQVPGLTRLVVAVVSALAAGMAVVMRNLLVQFVPTDYLQFAGGVILIILGIKMVWEQNFDVDSSQSIDVKEGILLGLALALDSFCTGLSLGGFDNKIYAFPFLVGGATYGFLWLSTKPMKRIPFCDCFAGVLLVILGGIQSIGIFI